MTKPLAKGNFSSKKVLPSTDPFFWKSIGPVADFPGSWAR
jgi:hypothetical protein